MVIEDNKYLKMSVIFYPFSWHDQKQKDGAIEVFGWTEKGRTAYLKITGFTPYIYVKLNPAKRELSEKATIIRLCREKAIKTVILSARGIYSNIFQKEDRYVFVSFASDTDRTDCTYQLKKGGYQVCENCAIPTLQMTCERSISTADWFSFIPDKETSLESYCNDSYSTYWKTIKPLESDHLTTLNIPSPTVMAYDIETYAHDSAKFCDSQHPEDVIFQISCVVGTLDDPEENWQNYILSLGHPDMSVSKENIILQKYKSEASLLKGYVELIKATNPQILIGYNTFGFDNKYMTNRAKHLMIYNDFVRQGCTFEKCEMKGFSWSSSAYSNQEINYLDTKGRVHIDLLTLIKRDHKLDNYKLNTVAQHFLAAKKDPLNYNDIHCFYRRAMETPTELSQHLGYVAAYCVKDSLLVFQLFKHLKYWIALMQMSKVCQSPMAHLFQHGQQRKVYCQVYKFCTENGIIVENDVFNTDENDYVQGALVLDAVPGLYDNVVSFDFASLYPSIIISHNIDYSTLAKDTDPVDDADCHIVEWEEHFGCGHSENKAIKNKGYSGSTIVCKKYRYRWLKNPKGVIPSILENLLSERSKVRSQMKTMKFDSNEYNVANVMQLALKVSANSMYGALASKIGKLQFVDAGKCVTAVGRRSLRKISEIIEQKYGGKVIYGDTDSNYVKFRNMTPEKLLKFCLEVASGVSEYFPSPMKLEFEGKIYKLYFLFTKKRYIYIKLGSDALTCSGVMLKRRDNSSIVKDVYKSMVYAVLRRETEEELIRLLYSHIAVVSCGSASADQYAISSSVKTIDKFEVNPGKSAKRVYFGCYSVPKISDDEKKKDAQFKKTGAQSEEEFYYKSLPSHVQLAIRMRERGQQIQNGSRLSFLYIQGAKKARTVDKMEEIEYFKTFYSPETIDTMYYIHLLQNPLAELFTAYLSIEYASFFQSIYNACIFKKDVINELKQLFNPVVELFE